MLIDIHTHILFGMDDGAKDLDESLAMIEMQVQQGVETIVLTPHFNPLKQDLASFINKRDQNYQTLLKANKYPVTIKKGAEVYYSSTLLEMELDELTIEGTDYLLVEFSTRAIPSNLKGQMQELLNIGVIPIIAHIERYSYFRDNPQLIVDLINQGLIMQVNVESILDFSQRRYIKKCLKHNLIHLIATDTHSIIQRVPNLREAQRHLKIEQWLVLNKNAKRVLENELLQIGKPKKTKGFLNYSL